MVQEPRDALLARAVEHLRAHGFSDASLRELAAGLGTSHRMLLYHFGSRQGLLAAVVAHVEAQQRAAFADLDAATGDVRAVCLLFWRRISDPALAPAARLFFEVYAHALRGEEWTAAFRADVIAAWERPLARLFVRAGLTRAQARRRARLSIAVARGLLLDLLVTGDRRAVDAAARDYFDLAT